MTDFYNIPCLELLFAIVNYGMGSKLMHKAKEFGISGGTVIPGKGTVNSSFLKLLSLYDIRREVVIMGTDSGTAHKVIFKLNKTFHFEKPNRGIIFSIPINCIYGSRCNCGIKIADERGAKKSMYKLITTIVNRGKAEDVISAANKAGAKGGTILNARGSGIHETVKLFNMEIEPEKEMVMIIAANDVIEGIVKSINENLQIDKPGNGIIFVQDVINVYGIYK